MVGSLDGIVEGIFDGSLEGVLDGDCEGVLDGDGRTMTALEDKRKAQEER